jgi:PAS domain S-box-containing protein
MKLDGTLLQVNPAFVAMLGCEKKSLEGRFLFDLWIPEDRAVARQRLHTCLTGNGGGLNVTESRYRCRDGRTVWGRLTTSLIRGENGEVLYGLGMVEDITEERTAGEERERLLEELRNAVAHVKTLSGMLPICASCKKIRDDEGYWTQVETYLGKHTDAQFSHGLCPDCARRLYPGIFSRSDGAGEPT